MAQPSRVKENIKEMILATDKDDDANATTDALIISHQRAQWSAS
jgi:recombinational DNA repair protein RecR